MLVATSVSATERLPPAIQRDLQLPYEPPCSLCHLKGNTGLGTANTPFALAMRARGMTSNNVSDLATALDALKRDRVDVDGDGVIDVDELVAGTDPNTPAASELRDRTDPAYGCGGGDAHHGKAVVSSLVLALGVAFSARRHGAHCRRSRRPKS